jgi:hypothetical protein
MARRQRAKTANGMQQAVRRLAVVLGNRRYTLERVARVLGARTFPVTSRPVWVVRAAARVDHCQDQQLRSQGSVRFLV